MGRDTGRLREEVRERLRSCGAVAVGFAEALPVADSVARTFDSWIASGKHAGMDYMTRHRDVRLDPRLLLPGASTVISMAFSYQTEAERDSALAHISSYALLPDYHKWIRKLIRHSGVGELLGREQIDWRICIDSAPVLERYWAAKAGIAVIGLNGSAIIPGIGSKVFLAEIISTTAFEPDSELPQVCGDCMKCIQACPTGALGKDGIECDSCISYLTIEHRGEWHDKKHRDAMATQAGRHTLFGCDRCVESCPHNMPGTYSVVKPVEGMCGYVYDGGDPPSGSALKRAGKDGLARNHANLKDSRERCC